MNTAIFIEREQSLIPLLKGLFDMLIFSITKAGNIFKSSK